MDTETERAAARGTGAVRRIAASASAGIAAVSLAAVTGCSAPGLAASGQAASGQAASGQVAGSPTAPAIAPAAVSTPVATSPAPATPAATPAAPVASAAPSGTQAAAGPAPCATRSLQVKPGIAQGTPGSAYQVLDFTNISGVACTLYGYPGVSFAGGTPVSQIGPAATEDAVAPRQLVALAPGAVANALLRIVNAGVYPPSTCHPVTARYLVIYPPDQTTPVYVRYHQLTCAKPVQILSVSVIQPGSGG